MATLQAGPPPAVLMQGINKRFGAVQANREDRKSTRLNSSHG